MRSHQKPPRPITLVITEAFGHQKTLECFLISSWGKVESGVIRNLHFLLDLLVFSGKKNVTVLLSCNVL